MKNYENSNITLESSPPRPAPTPPTKTMVSPNTPRRSGQKSSPSVPGRRVTVDGRTISSRLRDLDSIPEFPADLANLAQGDANITEHDVALQALSSGDEPLSEKELLQRKDLEEWLKAEEIEWKAIVANGTIRWIRRDEVAKGTKIIKSKWVWKRKPDRYKARCVAKGFMQSPFDYGETYAPVAKFSTIRSTWPCLRLVVFFGLVVFAKHATIGVTGVNRHPPGKVTTGYGWSDHFGLRSQRATQPKIQLKMDRPFSLTNLLNDSLREVHEARVPGSDVNQRLVWCFLISKEAPTRCHFTSDPRTWPPLAESKSGSTWRRRSRHL